jgi:hypothetical protein
MQESHEWPKEPDHSAMAVLGSMGDVKRIWDRSNTDEVEDARASFDRLRERGHLAFRVNKDGTEGEQMDAFEPNAERMILVPQMQGG